ncbi:MAG TPA: hypothetical protein VFV99_05210, partial [Kofleriaceae bacterium]|nr:hypothetical protein [Kofleriaceae bacterium]
MRRVVVGSLVLSFATVARADDPRDVFGLGKKPTPQKSTPQKSTPQKSTTEKTEDVRDVFGLTPKQQQAPLDCSDGTEFGCVDASDPLDEHETPYGLVQWLSGKYLLSLPVADATHEQVAHYALGGSRDEAGPAFRGANGLENRWLIDGAPADGLRTGVADTRIPLTFLDGMWVQSGGFT